MLLKFKPIPDNLRNEVLKPIKTTDFRVFWELRT